MLTEKIRNIDRAIMSFMANRRNPVFDDIFAAISALCSPINVLIYLALAAALQTDLSRNLLVYVAVTWFVVYTIKFIVSRDRPEGSFEAGLTASFPSAHSATAFLLAGLLSQIFSAASVMLYILAILVAISRLYLQSHYLSDVTAGSLIGLAVFLSI